MRDVVVIGAGPAGSLTARRLAEHGHDVVLLEEHQTIGQPVHCTGLLGFDAFDEFSLPRSTILGCAEAARFWGAAGRSGTVQGGRARAAVIDRSLRDASLAVEAERAGVAVKCGVRVESVQISDRGVTVQGRGSTDTVSARACVLACGANYRFHGPLHLGAPQVFLQSAQLEVPFPDAEAASVEVQFGRDVAPAGFAWKE